MTQEKNKTSSKNINIDHQLNENQNYSLIHENRFNYRIDNDVKNTIQQFEYDDQSDRQHSDHTNMILKDRFNSFKKLDDEEPDQFQNFKDYNRLIHE